MHCSLRNHRHVAALASARGKRFPELLEEQSTENLAALNRHVDQARKQIRECMALVNEGLSEAEFNTGT